MNNIKYLLKIDNPPLMGSASVHIDTFFEQNLCNISAVGLFETEDILRLIEALKEAVKIQTNG